MLLQLQDLQAKALRKERYVINFLKLFLEERNINMVVTGYSI